MQEDAKADKTFYRACLPVLKKSKCLPDADKHAQGAEIGMAAVLKCLMDYEATNEEDRKWLLNTHHVGCWFFFNRMCC